jgi:DNA polymerase III epsilon subunit-like protein
MSRKRTSGLGWLTQELSCVVIDTETTGLGPKARAVEIAAVDLWSGDVLLNTRLNPDVKPGEGFTIEHGAWEAHGIERGELIDEPLWGNIQSKLREILEKADVFLAYNAPFDRRIIEQHNRAWNDHNPVDIRVWPHQIQTRCVMRAYANTFGEWSEYWGSFTWVKLEEAASHLGIEHEDAHTALADAQAAREVALALIKHDNELETR